MLENIKRSVTVTNEAYITCLIGYWICENNIQHSEGNNKTRPRQGERWSDRELTDLKKLYPVRPNRALVRHFGRSEMSITNKANQLGLTKQLTAAPRRFRPWSDLEIDLLKQLHPDTSLEDIAAELVGRSILAVQEKALELGLRRLQPWTAEEIALLRKLWANTAYSDIADRLNRSIYAIKGKGYKLGLPRQQAKALPPGHSGSTKRTRRHVHPWSTDEIKCLKHHYPTTPIKMIALYLDRPRIRAFGQCRSCPCPSPGSETVHAQALDE